MAYAFLLLLAVLAAWAMFAFNRLVRLRNQVRTAWPTSTCNCSAATTCAVAGGGGAGHAGTKARPARSELRCRRWRKRSPPGSARSKPRWNANSGG